MIYACQGKVLKLPNSITNALIVLVRFTISSCSEGRTWDVHSCLLIDVYVSFLTLVSGNELQWPWRRFRTFLLKSDVNLFNHLVRSGCCGCCSAGSRPSLTWGCQYSVSLVAYCLKLFYVKLMRIELIRYLRHNWLFDVVLMASTHVVICRW